MFSPNLAACQLATWAEDGIKFKLKVSKKWKKKPKKKKERKKQGGYGVGNKMWEVL